MQFSSRDGLVFNTLILYFITSSPFKNWNTNEPSVRTVTFSVSSMDYSFFYEADLNCDKCGYHAYIHDGIFFADHSKHISPYDKPDKNRTLYRDSPSMLLSMVQKSNNWIMNRLSPLVGQGGKTIMETHLNCIVFCRTACKTESSGNLFAIIGKVFSPHHYIFCLHTGCVLHLHRSFFQSLQSSSIVDQRRIPHKILKFISCSKGFRYAFDDLFHPVGKAVPHLQLFY